MTPEQRQWVIGGLRLAGILLMRNDDAKFCETLRGIIASVENDPVGIARMDKFVAGLHAGLQDAPPTTALTPDPCVEFRRCAGNAKCFLPNGHEGICIERT